MYLYLYICIHISLYIYIDGTRAARDPSRIPAGPPGFGPATPRSSEAGCLPKAGWPFQALYPELAKVLVYAVNYIGILLRALWCLLDRIWGVLEALGGAGALMHRDSIEGFVVSIRLYLGCLEG